jgi:MYXO-CTERM domain-containing protein
MGQGGEGCTRTEKFAQPNQAGDYYFDPDPSSFQDPFAEVQMYYHLDLISAWFDENFGFAHPTPIEGLVNFEYNNAAYGNFDADPAAEVGFGQSGGYDLAYDGDVIYHEFGHSVFGSVAGQTGFLGFDEYGMEWATGGINEGTADSFSMVLTGDPRVGDYAGQAFGYDDAIRDLEEDRHCPTDLYGQSHTDGEVLGALVWNVIDDPLLGAEFAGEFFWGAVSALPVNANWMDLSETLVESADDLLADELMEQAAHDRLIELLEAAGLDSCGRVIRLDEGQEPLFLLFSMRFAGDLQVPSGNQFSLDAPEGTWKLRFRVNGFVSGEPNLAYTVFVRRGEHVVHEPHEIETGWGSFEMPGPVEYDFSVDGAGDDFELELTLDSDPPLVPGETYYFSVNARAIDEFQYGWVNAEVTVDGTSWIEDVVEPMGDDDDDGAGCQDCNSSVSAGSAPMGLLVLALGAVLLRRRS